MREIKFRAWHKGMKKMFFPEEMGKDQLTIMPDGRGFVNVSGISTKLSEIDNGRKMTPMQYTGLKDNNGVEIYEGDILHNIYRGHECKCGLFQQDEDKNHYVVEYITKWLGSGAHYMARSIEKDEHGSYDNWLDGGCWGRFTEIIGNIYENPELLKEIDNA